MQFRKFAKTLSFCSVILASVGFGGIASADVYQEFIYPGNECRPVDGSRWSSVSSYYNRLKNNGGSGLNVVCPVVRHYTQTREGPNLFAVTVDKPTNDPWKRLNCTLYVMDGNGNIVDYVTVGTSSAGKQYLSKAESLNADRFSGEYTVYCSLPAGASIYNYKVHEYSDIEN